MHTDIKTLEEMHADVQASADRALGLAAVTIQMARLAGQKLNEVLKDLTAENATMLLEDCSADLQAWVDSYRSIALMPFPDRMHEAPVLVRDAMQELQLIPTSV